MIFRKKVTKKNLFREQLNILNSIFQLSERELQVLTILMYIDSNWVPSLPNEKKNVLSTDKRRMIMKETLVNKNNLSKYLTTFKEKNILIGGDGNWHINEVIIPSMNKNDGITSNGSEIVFILEVIE
jgi:hypothetical protein